jgi:serine/threonine-protein kinase RsbW
METLSFTLELKATPEEVMRAVGRLQHFCKAHHVEEKAIQGLMLGLEEMASNIVNHAYRHDPLESFRVSVQYAGDRVIVELRDRGPAFDPLQAPEPALDDEDEDRPEGGWGIRLVRHSIDELQYRREGAENVLQMTQRIQPGNL